MMIEEVNRQPVKDLKEFEVALKKAASVPRILLLVNKEGAYRYLIVKPPNEE